MRDATAHPDGGWVVLIAGPGKDRLLRVQSDLISRSILSCNFGEAMTRGDEIDNFPRIAIGGSPPAILVTVRSPLTATPPFDPGIAVVSMDGRLIHNIAQQPRRYHGIAVAPGANRLYLLAEDGTVWRYENFYDRALQPVRFATLPVGVGGRDLGYNSVWRTVTPNLIAVGTDGNIYSIDLQTGRVERLTLDFLRGVYAVDFEQSLAAFARNETGWLDDSNRQLVCVSAASFKAELASESIAAAFGSGLATTTQSATSLPLPTTLAGTRVSVCDQLGVERPAPLFFVSPNQVNFLLPPGTAIGAANIVNTSGDNQVSTGSTQIATVTPGLFSANASGQGVVSGVALRVKADGTQTFESIARFDQAQNRFVPVPIDLGLPSDQVFLLLFGSGIRGRTALNAVSCSIGGMNVPVTFAGAQGGLVGLDQINVGQLPRSLAGRGEVDVTCMVEGKAGNTVRASIK